MQSLSDGRAKISKPKTDASPTHSSNTFPSPVSLSIEIYFGLRLAYPAGDGSAAILRVNTDRGPSNGPFEDLLINARVCWLWHWAVARVKYFLSAEVAPHMVRTRRPQPHARSVIQLQPATNQKLGAAIIGVKGGAMMSHVQLTMMGKQPYTALRDGIFARPTLWKL